MVTQPRLQFSEAERPLGERLLKVAAETDRVEGYRTPHAQELARLAEKLGQQLGLRGVDLSALKFAALAHDVGERNMKRDYLLRPAGLSWEEQLDLWRHPIIGEQAAAELKMPRLAQLLVRWHHEWWNGQGYPDGLAGTAIPLGARILRVVDTYLALLSDRPHRVQLEASQVEQFITDQAGIETDPEVVKAFLTLLAEERPVIEEPVASEPDLPSYETPASDNAPLPFISAWDVTRGSSETENTNEPDDSGPTTDDKTTANDAADNDISNAPTNDGTTDQDAWATQEAPADEALLALKTAQTPATEVASPEIAETLVASEAAASSETAAAIPATNSDQEESVAPANRRYDVLETNPFPPDELGSGISAHLAETPPRVVALSDAPDHFWPVAQWIYDQWWATPDNTVQVVSEQLKEHLADHPLPCTLVAVVGQRPVGSICLLESAGALRPDLAPCLAALFVLPEYRHRGIATQLLEAAYAKAKAQGVPRVFFTVPEQEDFLARRGWQVLEPAVGAQALIVLYKD